MRRKDSILLLLKAKESRPVSPLLSPTARIRLCLVRRKQWSITFFRERPIAMILPIFPIQISEWILTSTLLKKWKWAKNKQYKSTWFMKRTNRKRSYKLSMFWGERQFPLTSMLSSNKFQKPIKTLQLMSLIMDKAYLSSVWISNNLLCKRLALDKPVSSISKKGSLFTINLSLSLGKEVNSWKLTFFHLILKILFPLSHSAKLSKDASLLLKQKKMVKEISTLDIHKRRTQKNLSLLTLKTQ